MRMKYIIVALLASVGLIGGVWNWINYFKAQNAGNIPQVQATRPPPKPEIAALEQQSDSGAAPAAAREPVGEVKTRRLNIDLPDTLGRDPFLTPEEIELIASGKFVEDAPPPTDTLGLRVTAVMQDNHSGEYVALIGGRSYRKGDMIGAEKVVEITESQVVLEQAGHRRTLYLRGQEKESGINIELRSN